MLQNTRKTKWNTGNTEQKNMANNKNVGSKGLRERKWPGNNAITINKCLKQTNDTRKTKCIKKKKRNIHNNLPQTSTLSLRSYISLQINWNNKYGLKETVTRLLFLTLNMKVDFLNTFTDNTFKTKVFDQYPPEVTTHPVLFCDLRFRHCLNPTINSSLHVNLGFWWENSILCIAKLQNPVNDSFIRSLKVRCKEILHLWDRITEQYTVNSQISVFQNCRKQSQHLKQSLSCFKPFSSVLKQTYYTWTMLFVSLTVLLYYFTVIVQLLHCFLHLFIEDLPIKLHILCSVSN